MNQRGSPIWDFNLQNGNLNKSLFFRKDPASKILLQEQKEPCEPGIPGICSADEKMIPENTEVAASIAGSRFSQPRKSMPVLFLREAGAQSWL